MDYDLFQIVSERVMATFPNLVVFDNDNKTLNETGKRIAVLLTFDLILETIKFVFDNFNEVRQK
ncbi:MAG: hypothetical protein K2M08_07825 [Anaeroplasmataceae bacterium]|nr:hypothetical protein [Anaeroplasmataceae bacterium]